MMIFPPPDQTIDKGHGRLETRRLRATPILNDYLEFPYCGQVFKIERETIVLKTGEIRSETAYGITSLPPQKADNQRLLSLIRGQWSIENKSHWVRDVTFDEDRHQARKGKGPQMMACLRNAAISLMRLAGYKNIASATREFAARCYLAFKLLCL